MKIPSSFQLATSGQSRQIDSETISKLDISGRILMEVAGAKAAAIIQEHIEPRSNVLLFCGKGNNAGDALVIARFLSQNNICVEVVFAEGTENLSPDADVNFKLLKKLQAEDGSTIIVHENLPELDSLNEHDFIIDGLLGSGIKNKIREPYNRIIDYINGTGKTVYALDLPTGLHADNGTILGNCVQADFTFCFGTQKLGCYLENGPQVSGKKIYCDLGFPGFLRSDIHRYVIDAAWTDKVKFPKKSPLHKYEAGIVYIIAGSPGLTGAAVMAAESAWSEGLGSVSVLTPGGLWKIFESHFIHQTKFIVGSKDDVFFKTSHLNEILEHINRREGTVVIGPGVGRAKETAEFVRNFVLSYQGKIVIDADALWALSGELSVLPNSKASMILTPHPGELKSLVESEIHTNFDRMTSVEDFCRENQVYLLSKGLPNIIGTPTGRSFITQYDSTIFARTGFGDILTGKIAALWDRNDNPEFSCIKALLDGKSRYDEHRKHYSTLPEPLDLI